MQRHVGILATAQSDGPAHSNSTTSASLLPTQAKPIIPGGYFSRIGQEISIVAAGNIFYLGAGGGTIQFILRRGPTALTDDIALSPGFALNTSFGAIGPITWQLRWHLTLRSVGSAASFMHTGFFASQACVGAPVGTAGGRSALLIPASAPAVGPTFDSTIDNIIDLTADWSVASASNSIQLMQYNLISWN